MAGTLGRRDKVEAAAVVRAFAIAGVRIGLLCVALGASSGCRPTNVCGFHDEPLILGGGQPACTLPDDCPREQDELVCESNIPTPSHNCVRCVNALCERSVLEFCE